MTDDDEKGRTKTSGFIPITYEESRTFFPYTADYGFWILPTIGIRLRFLFPNGYQASVVRGPYTYGGTDGMWELAVMDHYGQILYDTPITDDVIGFLTREEVVQTLKRIEELPKREDTQ
jgi:hypothetical protein